MKMITDTGVKYRHPWSKQKRRCAIYECPLCGKEFETTVQSVKRNKVKSCGCYHHGLVGTHIHRVFHNLKSRCNNPNNQDYAYYGGRGIKVCPEWNNNFMAFRNWAISNGYSPELEIDRRENNEGYSPENCRWITTNSNKQNTRLIRKSNTTGYRGVVCHKNFGTNKYEAKINYNKKSYQLGCYPTGELAAQAYNDFVIRNKTFHPLNVIK